ncbi:MAG: GntR family transcriptional regulator [Acidimicrobiia bacterium]
MTSTKGFELDGSVAPRATAEEQVRRVLRASILRGDLPGGTRLVQTDIAKQLGVSTTPVREAMRALASDGLISLDNHRIGTVRTPEREEMLEIVDIRHMLNVAAVERAMENITDDELERAGLLAQRLTEDDDLGAWVEGNIAFHAIFHTATRTIRLQEILLSLEEAAGVFVAQAQRFDPELRKTAIEEHFALLDAYAAGDSQRAIKIVHSHVSLPLGAF